MCSPGLAQEEHQISAGRKEGSRGGRQEEGREERGKGEGYREGGDHRHHVSRAGPHHLCMKTHDPVGTGAGAAERKQSLPLRCGPVFRHWPSPPTETQDPAWDKGWQMSVKGAVCLCR